MDLQVELAVTNQATVKIQFYKSKLHGRLCQWYKNMIAATLQ